MKWENQFKNRIDDFERKYGDGNGIAISIKLRVDSGCFHREHSPSAYEIIDREIESLDSIKEKAVLIEHESGPEILVYLSLISGSIVLTAAIINLITAIINARKSDRQDSKINLIVRNFNKNGEIKEEKIITLDKTLRLDKKELKNLLEKGIKNILNNKK
jgi:hypothetical protein